MAERVAEEVEEQDEVDIVEKTVNGQVHHNCNPKEVRQQSDFDIDNNDYAFEITTDQVPYIQLKKIPLQSSSSKTKQIPILSLPHLSEIKAPVYHAPVGSGMINISKETSEITATT